MTIDIQEPAELEAWRDVVGESTVCGAFQRTVASAGDAVALRTRGDATTVTWAEYGAHVRRVAAGLAALGLRRQESVAVQLSTRPEFHFVDMGALHLGAIPFGVYNSSTPAQIADRLRNSDCRIYVTERAFLETAERAIAEVDGIEHLIVIDGDDDRFLDLHGLEEAGHDDFDFEASWRSVAPEDLITLVYTSGTTGPPKGVQWSHDGVMTLLRAFSQRVPLPTSAVSYLPMAHSAERLLTHFMTIPRAATVTCCPVIKEVLVDVQQARPDFFATVPRTWVKLRAAIEGQIDALPDPERRQELLDAIAVGVHRATLDQAGKPVDDDLAAEHERAKAMLRAEFLAGWGLDNLKAAFIGSAAVPGEVVLFFSALGVPLLEAYGLTEAHGFGATWPALDDFRIGTTGKPLPGVELTIAEDGEVLLRSRMTMVGYRKEPAATAAAIDAEGWLHTGDIGRLDADGFLQIIDRKKDIIISSAGKNMSPSNIEGEIRRANPVIGQVVCIGDGRHFNTALLTLDADGAATLARRHGLDDGSVAAVARHPAVRAEMEDSIARANEQLSRVEQVKKFTLLDVEWTPDSTELTPTMKIKRKQVAEKYSAEIEAMYSG